MGSGSITRSVLRQAQDERVWVTVNDPFCPSTGSGRTGIGNGLMTRSVLRQAQDERV